MESNAIWVKNPVKKNLAFHFRSCFLMHISLVELGLTMVGLVVCEVKSSTFLMNYQLFCFQHQKKKKKEKKKGSICHSNPLINLFDEMNECSLFHEREREGGGGGCSFSFKKRIHTTTTTASSLIYVIRLNARIDTE
jgi:hypothetical protein